MKLQTRLTLTLAAGVAVVIAALQCIQYLKLQANFEKVGRNNSLLLSEHLSDNADNVKRALNLGIAQALGAGDMDVFTKVA
jgi:hypothetical protein